MKKQLLTGLALVLCAGLSQAALPTGASAPAKLLDAPMGLMAPVWSPDGQMIALTGDNYTGIYVTRADGSDFHAVTTAAGAGYKMAWTEDSRSLVGRTNVMDGVRVMHELCSWTADAGKQTTIKGLYRGNGAPTLRAAGLSKKSANVYDIMTADPCGAAASIAALSAYAGKTVVNPALSPDGSKVAFQIVGNGMWVINADGTGLQSLGRGKNPAWMPDSQSLVYTDIRDNGSQLTASTIYARDLRSGATVTLADIAGFIPVAPAVSPDGRTIVVDNAADASIYTLTLKF